MRNLAFRGYKYKIPLTEQRICTLVQHNSACATPLQQPAAGKICSQNKGAAASNDTSTHSLQKSCWQEKEHLPKLINHIPSKQANKYKKKALGHHS
jgi:hypothetical protein